MNGKNGTEKITCRNSWDRKNQDWSHGQWCRMHTCSIVGEHNGSITRREAISLVSIFAKG